MYRLDDHRLFRSLFNADHLRHLAVYETSDVLTQCAKKLTAPSPGETFKAAYNILHNEYPIEYVIKNELLKWVREQNPEAYIRTEYWTAEHRADVVVADNDTCTVYEIKTRFDSTTRIKAQMEAYSKCFQHVVLVTERGWSNEFFKRCPPHVGLATWFGWGNSIKMHEKPVQYSAGLSKSEMLSNLNKPQKVALVKKLAPESKYVNTRYWRQVHELTATMTPEELNEHFRYYWPKVKRPVRRLEFLSKLPDCFTAALHDYYLLVRELKSLIRLMDTLYV